MRKKRVKREKEETIMKALVAYAPGDYRLEERERPRAGEGEMILKVEACGICAGQKHLKVLRAFGAETETRHISKRL